MLCRNPIFKYNDPLLSVKIRWCEKNGAGYGIDYETIGNFKK